MAFPNLIVFAYRRYNSVGANGLQLNA